MTPRDSQRIVRRLACAEGYLEIGLPARALAEIETVANPGPFEAIAALLRGEALQQAERFDEAIPALNRAAELFPQPFNQRALLGLSECYRRQGDLDLAAKAEAAAQTPDVPSAAVLKILVTPIFQVQTPMKRPIPPKG
ncbi:tetratricopeptide repeat protein [bacterium]|nr:tetratricopeptide repeat protein [bacterium]